MDQGASWENFPSPVLHTFALDCAERALAWVKERRQAEIQICIETLAIKRRWLDGQATEEERRLAMSDLGRCEIALWKIYDASLHPRWTTPDPPLSDLALRSWAAAAWYASCAAKASLKRDPIAAASEASEAALDSALSIFSFQAIQRTLQGWEASDTSDSRHLASALASDQIAPFARKAEASWQTQRLRRLHLELLSHRTRLLALLSLTSHKRLVSEAERQRLFESALFS